MLDLVKWTVTGKTVCSKQVFNQIIVCDSGESERVRESERGRERKTQRERKREPDRQRSCLFRCKSHSVLTPLASRPGKLFSLANAEHLCHSFTLWRTHTALMRTPPSYPPISCFRTPHPLHILLRHKNKNTLFTRSKRESKKSIK